MIRRQLALGWLVLLGCWAGGPVAAQSPAPAAVASGARSVASAPAAPATPAASAATPAASVASAAAPVAVAASAAPVRKAPARTAPARKPRKAASAPKPAASAAPVPSAAAPAGPSAIELAAEQAAHERELDAIRSALVETTVAAPVRVQSFGWIDAQGRLHEESQFTSDARVRGVRVQAYLDDPEAKPPAAPPAPQVTVDLETLPTGLGRRAEGDPQQCLARHGRWRQGLHLEVVAATGPQGAVPAPAARVAQGLTSLFLRAGRDSRRWVVQPRPYQPATPYERALLGREADTSDWLARIVVLTRAGGALEAELQLEPQGYPAAARRLSLPLPPAEAPAATWAARMAEWVAALDQATACDPMWFAVEGSGTRLRLREGGAHGLQAGDRLLLVQRQHLAGRLLEPGAVRSLALLQVEAAGGTALRWLAGARPVPAGGDWVALPL